MPLYSTEDGKVNLDGKILTQVATKNFTNPSILKENSTELKTNLNQNTKKKKNITKKQIINKDADFEDTDKEK